MKKIWVITMTCVQECNEEPFVPEVYTDKKTAKARFEQLYEQKRKAFLVDDKVYDVEDRGRDWFEFSLKDYYLTDRCRCDLTETSLREKGDAPVYSVWCGGSEVNDFYLTRKEAERLAEAWEDEGYDDVVIEKMF